MGGINACSTGCTKNSFDLEDNGQRTKKNNKKKMTGKGMNWDGMASTSVSGSK